MFFNFKNKMNEFELQIPNNEFAIPCLLMSSKYSLQTKTLVIFVNGLNGTKEVLYYTSSSLDYAHVVTYDARGCGKNKNPSDIHIKYFIEDLHEIIKALKVIFSVMGIENYIVVGESFGSAQTTLYYSKYQDEINAAVIWNMPYRLINVFGDEKKQNHADFKKLLHSLITNKATYSPERNINKRFIRNKLYDKLAHGHKEYDNRNTLVAWLGTRKAWHTIFKLLQQEAFLKPFIYISCEEDLIADKKEVALFDKELNTYRNNNATHISFSAGKHCLLMDDYASVPLMQLLNEVVLSIDHKHHFIDKKELETKANHYFLTNHITLK